VRTEVFSRKSISVLSYSWTQYLAVRGHFILVIARQNSLVETVQKAIVGHDEIITPKKQKTKKQNATGNII